MKQITKFFALVATIVAASACNKEIMDDSPVPGMKRISFKTEIENTSNDEVKTVLDGKKIKWEKGDALSIWDGTSQNKFTYNTGDNTFTGTISETATDFCAYYPELEVNTNANAALKTADDIPTFTTFLPSFQRVRNNSISQGALITACKPTLNGDNLSGQMQIMCGFLKFTIGDAENSKVAKVRFTGKSKYMSGRCNLVFGKTADESADSLYVESLNENMYVECAPASGEYFQNGTYYVAVLPYNNLGMTITVTTLDGKVYEYTHGSWVKHSRNQIVYVGQVDSKIATRGGLTSKYSIIANFENGHIEGLGTDKDKGDVPIVVQGHTLVTNQVYLKTGDPTPYIAQVSDGGYIKTPVVSGKTLKEVVVTYKGEKNTCKSGIYIKNGDGEYLSGIYYTSNAVTGELQKKYAIPVIGANNGYPLRISHVFVLGEKSKGETSTTIVKPEAETSYVINQSGKGYVCRISQVQLIYE